MKKLYLINNNQSLNSKDKNCLLNIKKNDKNNLNNINDENKYKLDFSYNKNVENNNDIVNNKHIINSCNEYDNLSKDNNNNNSCNNKFSNFEFVKEKDVINKYNEMFENSDNYFNMHNNIIISNKPISQLSSFNKENTLKNKFEDLQNDNKNIFILKRNLASLSPTTIPENNTSEIKTNFSKFKNINYYNNFKIKDKISNINLNNINNLDISQINSYTNNLMNVKDKHKNKLNINNLISKTNFLHKNNINKNHYNICVKNINKIKDINAQDPKQKSIKRKKQDIVNIIIKDNNIKNADNLKLNKNNNNEFIIKNLENKINTFNMRDWIPDIVDKELIKQEKRLISAENNINKLESLSKLISEKLNRHENDLLINNIDVTRVKKEINKILSNKHRDNIKHGNYQWYVNLRKPSKEKFVYPNKIYVNKGIDKWGVINDVPIKETEFIRRPKTSLLKTKSNNIRQSNVLNLHNNILKENAINKLEYKYDYETSNCNNVKKLIETYNKNKYFNEANKLENIISLDNILSKSKIISLNGNNLKNVESKVYDKDKYLLYLKYQKEEYIMPDLKNVEETILKG